VTKQQVVALIKEVGIIPAIRVASADDALFATEAVAGAGIPLVELTMTVPDAPGVIRRIRRELPDIVVGAGTVLDLASARISLDAGAMFLTSTGVVPEVAQFAAAAELVSIPGALTPTEVLLAQRLGADFIKIFPCAQLGGPHYIRALKGPFPHAAFIASGGVNQQNVEHYILCGATALGVGEHIVPHNAVKNRKADWIQELVGRFRTMIRKSRELLDSGQAETE
jgi:2-dehydro-3-deoxyphosphogluconate aldolase/(4S)-4-hydroxy-2-oxoglutarate aldolase